MTHLLEQRAEHPDQGVGHIAFRLMKIEDIPAICASNRRRLRLRGLPGRSTTLAFSLELPLIGVHHIADGDLHGFAGLYFRAPWTAAAAVILVLSLAGLPVTGGFFGKLHILLGSIQTQHYWLAGIMIGTSVVSYYYYFGFNRQMFMRSDYEGAEIRVSTPLGITLWLCTAVMLVMGFYPQGVLGWIGSVFTMTQDLFMMK
ncbi:NADH:ubiquinone oxidoreductase subunit 2 (subunit N) [Paenibacillus sp. V4I3]|uniref:proton-conducting transporter transmembrane domain-containing protein n=1 Tax=unclassified Paenibacillus TaxID=185978 RepID=UPI0027822077|nr:MULTISPECIES: proton-conducting transporter membrane subunit [unclassified Paenibacillus]MDQ0874567.1 NADH:ubiquinone oxidoreductase subunit 2 (subunit N) [Paenibacillus sp. V4I3]MDQ0889681.1 NADH:ubiquinone oxidoreductase subunit 2 (subunit N) [Paenibacillus sp. V4I9]